MPEAPDRPRWVAPLLGVLLMQWAAWGPGSVRAATERHPAPRLETLCVAGPGGRLSRFSVEIAATDRRRAVGLMYRRILPRDRGMLFLFRAERPVAMWMKNTFISLDMLFVAGSGRVVHIAEHTTPHSLARIPSNSAVVAVLEINAGEVVRRGIAVGDRFLHPWWNSRCPEKPASAATPGPQ